MKQIIYIKKFIKSEEDLPKETGYYFAGIKTDMFDEKGAIGTIEHFPLNDKEVHNSWLESIDWYFLPIELELPEDEEIEKVSEDQFPTNCFEKGDESIIVAFKSGYGVGTTWLRDNIKEQLKLK